MPESLDAYDTAGTKIENPKFSVENNESVNCKEGILDSKKEKQKFWLIGLRLRSGSLL